MSSNVEIVKKLFDACSRKDFVSVRSLVHPNYALKDPMMELHSADELIEMLQTCPSGAAENMIFIADGNKVVTLFDAAMDDGQKIRMCSIMTVEDGKVTSEEMLYDTAQIPQEIKDIIMQGKSNTPLTAH